jgi:uncharacterized protein YndB with AHSA1/START domain
MEVNVMSHVQFEPRTSIKITRTYSTSVERVWEAWTTPDLYARWVWAGMGRDPSATIDLRPGGLFSAHTTMDDADEWPTARIGVWGLYLEIDPLKKLAYTLHWEADVIYNRPGTPVMDEAVSVVFCAVEGGCEVTFEHFGIPDDGMSAVEHEKGERYMLKLLGQVLDA